MEISPLQALSLLSHGQARAIDVRSPNEFRQGHFPGSTNLPLLDDSQREQVGLCYHQQGVDEAISLGHRLVDDEKRRDREASWEVFAKANEQVFLYCARGGLRSQIACGWLRERGVALSRVSGGYKAIRQEISSTIERIHSRSFLILSGQSGSGKTELIQKLSRSLPTLDLEAAARHMGSTFGGIHGLQPSQASFENDLGSQLFRVPLGQTLLVEDEGKNIGSVVLPPPFFQQMSSAPRVILQVPFEERVSRIFRDYVGNRLRQEDPPGNPQCLEASSLRLELVESLKRISRRLGSERANVCLGLLDQAFEEQARSGDFSLHRQWIAYLLKEYYDPSYLYDCERTPERNIFRGTTEEVSSYLSEQLASEFSEYSPFGCVPGEGCRAEDTVSLPL